MKITQRDFLLTAQEIGLDLDQANQIWRNLEEKQEHKFNLTSVSYYLGVLIVIAAMSIFATNAWLELSPNSLLILSISYMTIFTVTGNALFNKPRTHIPGGLFITLALCMVPWAIYCFTEWMGWRQNSEWGNYRDFYQYIRSDWFSMEVGTILVALLALYKYRIPFLMAPLSFTLWFMSMDLTPLLFGEEAQWTLRQWVSTWFGLGTIVLAFCIDKKTNRDFAFWAYLMGTMTFWGGLSFLQATEWERALYCAINVLMMIVSVVLQRAVFVIFGAIGVFSYLSYLSWNLFRDSLLFPAALSSIGIGIMGLGILYSRYQCRIGTAIRKGLPAWITSRIPNSL